MVDMFSFLQSSLAVEQEMNYAICCKQVDKIYELIKNGYSINIKLQSEGGNTALHIAAKLGHENILLLLLDHGADPLVKNNFSFTPISLSARHNQQSCLKLLLSRAKNMPNILDTMWMQFGGSITLWREATEDVIATLICSTPNLRSARSNIQNNLCYLLITRSMFHSLKLLVISGYMLSRKDQHRLEISDESEKKVYLDWLKQFKMQPHSLRHYCRVTIRQAFESRANVFYGSRCLPIPTFLQDYVCMKSELHTKETDTEVDNCEDVML